ncbi:UDP-N-acetylmuramate:L-alanyl-gamma-D-glutamyl-meso-diaminopimelate ligase [Nitrosomonas ureae]|nr:UDP-N-acetylmuramate:L-alanyl-gamma-D-glutamyl-meso-diaminopimelate ligase [Nitrosomonas ureae]ALQ49869.1 UDP-N-acetylmuramate:L-alanyl-gamma-D-glutamyl-meso-diaminopimelate ligase [Nitrosomonas ureae]SDT84762.1 UDP-N-acetylmuramate: L-alanyl-gamma-D-glutamyl-meso-diaminopimelate ligase [Nitrosomonas ureae]
MHIHIVGICGTFMGGIAAIARESGYKVTGCDQDVYPPMSTQLESQGIELIPGYSIEQIQLQPDIFVIGNVITRGNPLMEEILNRNLPYISGPQWLSENILRHRWVLAVSGTHGKTTTSSMLAWILDYAGLNPGFLIGGIPENFGLSARIGIIRSEHTQDSELNSAEISPFFVIEADEYDTAFFDKRSKFVHYHPRTAILNNIEYDHADIFPDLSAIKRQFHHFVRIIPNNGLIIANGKDENIKQVLTQGCWTPLEEFGTERKWNTQLLANNEIDIYFAQIHQGCLHWDLLGEHNRMNALAALIAARHAGVPVETGIAALSKFKSVKRRMEKRGTVNGVTVYDDFAHHPTAIQTTLNGLRTHVGRKRIIAVLEPRSNTMKMSVWKDYLAHSLQEADHVFCFTRDSQWAKSTLCTLNNRVDYCDDLNQLIQKIVAITKPEDHVLIMSNGGFGGIHDKLLSALQENQ